MSSRVLISLFKVVAVAEALSWLGLLIGMYFKWVAATTEVGVHVFGPIHGGVFIVYVALTLAVAWKQRWSVWTTLVGLACSIPPFATLAFELWAQRTGRLSVPVAEPPREPASV